MAFNLSSITSVIKGGSGSATQKRKMVIAVASAVGMFSAAGIAVYDLSASTRHNAVVDGISSLSTYGRKLATDAELAAKGDASGVNAINTDYQSLMSAWEKAGSVSNIQKNAITELADKVKIVEERKGKLAGIAQARDAMKMDGDMTVAAADQLLAVLLQKGASSSDLAVANKLRGIYSAIPTEIVKTINGEIKSDEDVSRRAKDLQSTARDMSEAVSYFSDGGKFLLASDPDVESRVKVLTKASESFTKSSSQLLSVLVELSEAEVALKDISSNASSVGEIAANVKVDSRIGFLWLAGLLSILSVAGIGMIFWLNSRDEKANADKIQSEKDQMDDAIIGLLKELDVIAKGDLTKRATVNEEVTGVISDSINTMVTRLADVVRGIGDASGKVDEIASNFGKVAENVRNSTDKQGQVIDDAANSVTKLNDAIQAISAAADQSAEVARESSETAEAGQGVVGRTIEGMGVIRDRIQDVSKRIKRLGESSQEIGEIADLVSEITEKTNVLALNAFVEAERAGEQGRGFRVIATEIKNLAEQAGEGLGRVNTLIGTIQTDMKEAIASMEQSTNQVVEGETLANEAGDALRQIRQVSDRINEIVSEIAKATDLQTSAAHEVNDAMGRIVDISHRSKEDADSVGYNAGLITGTVNELKASVAGLTV